MIDTPNYLAGIEKRRRHFENTRLLRESLPEDLHQLRMPTMNQQHIFSYALSKYSEVAGKRAGGILIHGSVGRGKSLLTSTLLHYAVDKFNQRAVFINSSQIERGFRSSWAGKLSDRETDLDIWRKIENADVTAIDDIGTEGSDHVVRFIRQAIDHCASENKIMILTTNLNEEMLWKYLGSEDRDISRRSTYAVIDFTKSMPDLRKGEK